MSTRPETAAFDRAIRPFLQLLLPSRMEEVLSFRADPALQQRIEELACKSNEGQLTEGERAELEGYARANKLVAILQNQARQLAEPA